MNFTDNYLQDLEVNQFGSDKTVATPSDAESQGCTDCNNEDNVWSVERKMLLVRLDLEEREKGKGFMARVKRRWDQMYPNLKAYSAKALRNSAALFKNDMTIKELYEGDNFTTIDLGQDEEKKTWKTSEKVKLVQIDIEERAKGVGFMKRIQGRWKTEFREDLPMQMLRDNAARFGKEEEIKTVILTRQDTEGVIIGNINECNEDNLRNRENDFVSDDAFETQSEDEKNEGISFDEDGELLKLFSEELENGDLTWTQTWEKRTPLPKLKMTSKMKDSANRILNAHLKH